MKIALAQLNYTIGDFEGNLGKMVEYASRASEKGAHLVVFSELAICGYPPLDFLERQDFISRSLESVETLARKIDNGTGVLVGGPEFNRNQEGKLLHNAVFYLYGGKVQQVFRKTLLPTYDIFDEYRYFEPNRDFSILELCGERIAVTICEDLWDQQPFESEFSRSRLYTTNPLEEIVKYHPSLVINLAASPFSHRKMEVKQSIFTGKAYKHGIPVLYCNQVGAQTELIFEGGSLVIDPRGNVMHRMAYFREDFFVAEIENGNLVKGEKSGSFELPDRICLMADALVCGIRDYFRKMGFKKATLGLSGGIDSAVTLVLAVRALGPENLHVLMLPSQYSSGHSIKDAEELAGNLRVPYRVITIEKLFNQFREALQPLFGDRPEDIAEENIQARIRGTLLMALSNKFGNILLNTSNKSETAVGYGTLYGDMSGGLSVLGDVYKTDVYRLAEYFNREREVIPVHIITKPPSAELKPEQKDTDSLPPYEDLDKILEAYIERQVPPDKIPDLGLDQDLVKKIIRMVDQNEYKRYQTPPILRVSSKAFGVGRRLPLVARF